MSRFRVGAKVVVTKDGRPYYEKGEEAVVLEHHENGTSYLRFGTERRGGTDWWAETDDLEEPPK